LKASSTLFYFDSYIKDAAECESCQEIWKNFKEQREKELSVLLKELKAHIDKGIVSLE